MLTLEGRRRNEAARLHRRSEWRGSGAISVLRRVRSAERAREASRCANDLRSLFAASGGLISYGPNSIDPFRGAAGYVDRILKGEKPADLPVQAPTKYDLVINLKAAKEIDLSIPPSVLARADEVIE
jgi:ABC transporter substrate binding protein